MLIDVKSEIGRGPFLPRKSGGSIDPVTGMYTVDPIVVYDALEGIERSNVTKSCYAWSNIRSVFAQCYSTMQHAVERRGGVIAGSSMDFGSNTPHLLELLLSF